MTESRVFSTVPLLLALACAGCGQSPGHFDFVRADAVSRFPEQTAESDYGGYVQITLVSKTSSTVLSNALDAVYPHAGDCKSKEPKGIIAFGPYDDNGFTVPSRSRPQLARSDGRFDYKVYMVKKQVVDVIRGAGEVCLVLVAPQMPYARFSNRIRVPTDAIERALQ